MEWPQITLGNLYYFKIKYSAAYETYDTIEGIGTLIKKELLWGGHKKDEIYGKKIRFKVHAANSFDKEISAYILEWNENRDPKDIVETVTVEPFDEKLLPLYMHWINSDWIRNKLKEVQPLSTQLSSPPDKAGR